MGRHGPPVVTALPLRTLLFRASSERVKVAVYAWSLKTQAKYR